MILLDTHIWLWLVGESTRLTTRQQELIKTHQTDGLGVSVISCWETAKLVEHNRISFSRPLEEWMTEALEYPGIRLIDLTPHIAIESTQLPEGFHRDPSDEIIVATARVLNCNLMTADEKILNYRHVRILK